MIIIWQECQTLKSEVFLKGDQRQTQVVFKEELMILSREEIGGDFEVQ